MKDGAGTRWCRFADDDVAASQHIVQDDLPSCHDVRDGIEGERALGRRRQERAFRLGQSVAVAPEVWDDSSWAEARTLPHAPGSAPDSAAIGVGVQQKIADAYVVMRLAELVGEQRIGAVVESAVANCGGNGGCLALERLAATLVKMLAPIGSEPAAAEIRSFWSRLLGG